jgi:hypothetical protein
MLTIGLTARQRILEIQAVESQGQPCPSVKRFQAGVVGKNDWSEVNLSGCLQMADLTGLDAKIIFGRA